MGVETKSKYELPARSNDTDAQGGLQNKLKH